MTAVEGCLACDLASGRRPLPGGTILRTQHWTIEHCIGPLPAGTLIVKPLRHVIHFADLTADEADETGRLLRCVSEAVLQETQADQTYICQWSHAGWEPGHIHFVVQPAWDSQQEKYSRPGPFLQAAMFDANTRLDDDAVAAICKRLRARLAERVKA